MNLNIGGHKFHKYDGYGRMVSGLCQSLLRAGHHLYPFELDTLDRPSWFLQAQGLRFDHTTVQFAPPTNFKHIPGRSVSWSMHESLKLPEGWADCINRTSQFLIVPSPWLVPVFEEGGVKVPISVVPGGIEPDECPVLPGTCTGNRPFTFICLADRGGRKGDAKVWAAFYKAFEFTNRDVRLIIKCRPTSLPNLDFSYSPDPRLTVWRQDVDNIADVFAQADACICPAKCEGYGMWPREAAACGLPTVVQRFSGTADDVDKWAIPLENYTLVESTLTSGGKWAEPSMDELVETMRWLYTHQDDARAMGQQSAQWMRSNQTYAHAADKLVLTLNKWLGGPPPVDEAAKIKANALVALRSNGHRIPVQ